MERRAEPLRWPCPTESHPGVSTRHAAAGGTAWGGKLLADRTLHQEPRLGFEAWKTPRVTSIPRRRSEQTTGDAGLTNLVESFEAKRAPWLPGINAIQSLARELRLRVVENVTTGELYRKYRDGSASSPIFQHYSICSLEPERRVR